MKMRHLMIVILLLAAVPALAQDQPGNLDELLQKVQQGRAADEALFRQR